MRLSIGQSIHLGDTEACQDGKVTLSVLVVNLDHAADEELLLFSTASLPVVRFADGHGKTFLTSPLLSLRLLVVQRIQMYVVFHRGKFLHWPRFSDGKCAICVLSRLV
jgi:hypothetical protein